MSYEDKRKETLQIFLKSLFKYPLRGSIALLQLCNRVLNIDIPPKSPFGKGGLRQGSLQRYINKKSDGKTIGLLVVPPQGLEPWTPTLRVSCSTN